MATGGGSSSTLNNITDNNAASVEDGEVVSEKLPEGWGMWISFDSN